MADKPRNLFEPIPDSANILSLLTQKMHDLAVKLYMEHPEYQEMSEEELLEVLKPDFRTRQIRLIFWDEVERVKSKQLSTISIKNIRRDVTENVFYKDIIGNQKRLAWILTPIHSRDVALREQLDSGRRHLAKILHEGPYSNGQIDYKKVPAFLKAYEMVENRVHGGTVQHIKQFNANVDLNKVQEDVDKSIEALQEKLAEEVEGEVLKIEQKESEDFLEVFEAGRVKEVVPVEEDEEIY